MVETDTRELLKVFSIENSKILYKQKMKIQTCKKTQMVVAGGRLTMRRIHWSTKHR